MTYASGVDRHVASKQALVRRVSWPVVLAGAIGCGSGGAPGTATNSFLDGGLDAGAHARDASSRDASLCGNCTLGSDTGTDAIASLTISPATATLIVTSGPVVTQTFTATAKYQSGSTGVVTATWSASEAPVGAIDANGLYTPKGTQGGVVTITAVASGQHATATLTVEIHEVDDQVMGGTPAATASALRGVTAALGDAGTSPGADAGGVNNGGRGGDGGVWDPTVQWTYPYDETVFPRGLNAPTLMWNNGAAADVYYVHLTSPTYDLESFATAPAPSRYAFTSALWQAFTNSTAGAAELTVARYSGGVATVITQQEWTIGSGSMSGTIYYWAINEGAVVRIKPGASAPDTFLAGATVPAPDGGAQPMQCPSCHAISSDGKTLVMSTGPWGASTSDVSSTVYNLQDGGIPFSGYERVNQPPSQLALAGVTPDGLTLVENWAPVRGAGAGQTDSPVDLTSPTPGETLLPAVTGTNLETLVGTGDHTYFPAFSPDNQLFVYVDANSLDLVALDWDAATRVFSSPMTLAIGTAVAGTKIAYPTISPDHRWVVYQRGPDYGSLDVSFTGDLYAVDTQNPGVEIPLDVLNGKGYPFAAGAARDADRDYEPTFAPVAAGGYFWVVFHSRRTYGNLLTAAPYVAEGTGTKQLWVAAIDLTPSGVDPSHEPFWLPGQDPTTLNMRGYWSLPPCAADGLPCSTGSDCCDGFCDDMNDAGAPVCGKPTSQTCSNAGDHCTTTADCCNMQQSGLTCINGACAAPPPR